MIRFWKDKYAKNKSKFYKLGDEDVFRMMQECIIAYLNQEFFGPLESAAISQHKHWQKYIKENAPGRITEGAEKFNANTLSHYGLKYSQLTKKEKYKDRLVVAIITDRILEHAGIGHERWIEAKEVVEVGKKD